MLRSAGLVGLLIASFAAPLAYARAQSEGVTRGPAVATASAPDSATVLRSARSAQLAFERARRRYLPRTFGRSGGPCGEIIGRFCYWDDDSTDDVLVRTPTPAESPRTAEARGRLLATLDSAGRALPADGWIAGMHVHYLLEAGRVEAAAERARECRAEEWWCEALAGLAEHAAWRYAAADSAFDRALARMPGAERCRWTNLDVLLDEEARDSYRRADCAARRSLEAHIWWLADPSHLRAGNDRRTEHFARVARARLHREAASGYATAWRDDLDEIVRRFGWPSHFTQQVPPPQHTGGPLISAYHESPSYHFLANGAVPADWRAVADSSWELRPLRTRERYAPPYATFSALTHQATLFRRGDSVVLVVAYDARSDSLLRLSPVTSALIASAGPSPAVEHRTVTHGAAMRGALLLTVQDTPIVASAELVAGARVLRARFGTGFSDAPARALRMSQLALFDPVDSLPRNLESFLPLARASSTIAPGSRLGLFWELYGAAPRGDDIALQIEIIREGGGWLRRAGERVGLVGRAARVGFGWRESAESDGVTPRALVVDLAGLDPGSYRIEVKLTPEGQTPITAQRRIEITR